MQRQQENTDIQDRDTSDTKFLILNCKQSIINPTALISAKKKAGIHAFPKVKRASTGKVTAPLQP